MIRPNIQPGKSANFGAAKPAPAPWHPILVLLGLLALPVIIFWRPGFFYIIDDWTALIQMAERPFGQYLLTPDGEQWFPFFHLLYYGLVKIAGEQYSILVLINCLGTGVNAFLLYSFCRRHWEPGLALTLSLLYAMSAAHHAIAWNAFSRLSCQPGVLSGSAAYHRPVSARPLGRQALGHRGCATLSILSHNYPLLGLLALPLYIIIMGEKVSWSAFWAVAGVVGLVCRSVCRRLFPLCRSQRRRQPQFSGIFRSARPRLSLAPPVRRPGIALPLSVLGSLPLSHPGLYRRGSLVDRMFGGNLVLGREGG